MTLEEYHGFEETGEQKHEFHDGEVLAMSGGTYVHARIATNLNGSLLPRLRGSGCEVLDSNMRVGVRPSRRYVYPESVIVCGGPQFDPDDRNRITITNPKVVIEVLSDSTEAYDRGEKFNHDRRLESMEEYVLVSQHGPLVETFWRQADGSWSMMAHEGIEAVARLRSVEVDLPLAEVYENVAFDGGDGGSSARPG